MDILVNAFLVKQTRMTSKIFWDAVNAIEWGLAVSSKVPQVVWVQNS